MNKQYQIKNHKSLCNQLQTLKNEIKEKEHSIPKDSVNLLKYKILRFKHRNFSDIKHTENIAYRKNLIGNFLSKMIKSKVFKNKGFLFKLFAGVMAKRTGKHIHQKLLSK
ncbi:hypothetical protein [Pedobacter nototheniae]|uniref:hypothetical protein n=1 Tax=Pedobacter nototheniae TaxID=2488994 RepID=UPI00103B2F5E|nr:MULTISPECIES: hypothetical protein [Pedobacter]